jgi:hypothetical protein
MAGTASAGSGTTGSGGIGFVDKWEGDFGSETDVDSFGDSGGVLCAAGGVDSGVDSGLESRGGFSSCLTADGGAIPGVAQDVTTNTARPMRMIRKLVKTDRFFTPNRVPFGTV